LQIVVFFATKCDVAAGRIAGVAERRVQRDEPRRGRPTRVGRGAAMVR
jgi:hypothetical protein